MACIARIYSFVMKDHQLSSRSLNLCCCNGLSSIYTRQFQGILRLGTVSQTSKQTHKNFPTQGFSTDHHRRFIRVYSFATCPLKEPLKSRESDINSDVSKTAQESKQAEVQEVSKKKKTILRKIIDELKHMYHGFRLLFIDIRISSKLIWNLIRGKSLTRREHNQLVRTVSDLFRLVPFSVFILVPFMEFLLPVALKLFPSLLPSTFQSENQREEKTKKALKVKLEMAKFLQGTLNSMALQAKGHESDTAKQFVKFFEKVRRSGEQASNEEILQFVKLFEDEITLDNLSRQQLIALSKVLELQTLGTNNFLQFQIRMRLRNLRADDKMIMKEGIDSLSVFELQQACKARGMRSYGLSRERLKSQLSQWLVLSLNEKVPPSLLLLSRTLYLSETLPTEDQLKATISALPDSVIIPTKVAIEQKEGKIDNKARLDLIREEEAKIKEEKLEKAQREMEKKERALQEEMQRKISQELSDARVHIEDDKIDVDQAEIIIDKAPVLSDSFGDVTLSAEDFQQIENAIERISKQRKEYMIEKEVIEELRNELSDYATDIKKLEDTLEHTSNYKEQLRQSKGAKRLYKKVNRMISKLENIVGQVERKDTALKAVLSQEILSDNEAKPDHLIAIDELLEALSKHQGIQDKAKIERIADVISRMDVDEDGKVRVEDILQVIEVISEYDLKVKTGQLNEIIELLRKEEALSSTDEDMENLISSNLGQKAPESSQTSEKI